MRTAKTPSLFRRRSEDMTLDEFLRWRVREMIEEEIERSREDVRP